MYRLLVLATCMVAAAGTFAGAREVERAAGCTADGLVHVETGAAIDRHVAGVVRLTEQGARLRDVSRLRLPCGFRVEPSRLGNLILTDGTEHRRYLENNPFGFAPAFGFGRRQAADETLRFESLSAAEVSRDECEASLRESAPHEICASFGSPTLFFTMVRGEGSRHRLVQMRGSAGGEERLALAQIGDRVLSLSFIQPPDAGGGTVTVLTTDGEGVYRFYIDSPSA